MRFAIFQVGFTSKSKAFIIIGRNQGGCMAKTKQKTYTEEDISLLSSALNELPDVTAQRLQKKNVLDALKGQIKELIAAKGYTVDEVVSILKNQGMDDITLKDIKDITASRSPSSRRKKNTSTSEGNGATE